MKRPEFVINFERLEGVPMIKVKLGEQTGYLELDTSSKECFLSEEFFKAHGNEDVLLPCEESEIGKTIGIITIRDYDFKVPMIVKKLHNPSIVGILGSNFFHRWKMILDFDAEMLYSYHIE